MTIAFYILWGLIPLFFFLMALWSYLEKTAGKKKHERPGDLFNQGLFVGFCVGLSMLIDYFVLPGIVESLIGDMIPYGVFQLILLPTVLYLAAKIIGPTKAIQISKAPLVSKSQRSK